MKPDPNPCLAQRSTPHSVLEILEAGFKAPRSPPPKVSRRRSEDRNPAAALDPLFPRALVRPRAPLAWVGDAMQRCFDLGQALRSRHCRCPPQTPSGAGITQNRVWTRCLGKGARCDSNIPCHYVQLG
ncbi:unnamed protein product [Arctogadus glacialis]